MSYSLNRASRLFHAELRRLIEQHLSEGNLPGSTVDEIHRQISDPLTKLPDLDQSTILLSSDERLQRHTWRETPEMISSWVSWVRLTRGRALRAGIYGIDLDQLLDVDLAPALHGDWVAGGYREEMMGLADTLESSLRLAARQLEQ